jgi:hypothetical protein
MTTKKKAVASMQTRTAAKETTITARRVQHDSVDVKRLTGLLGKLEQSEAAVSGVKRCSRCQQVKPLSEYYRNGKRMRTECKTCNGAMNAPRYQTEQYRCQKQDWYYHNRDEHIARSQKSRIERKFPYLRSEEHKQRAAEDYELRIHSAPMTFFNLLDTVDIGDVLANGSGPHGGEEDGQ